MDSDYEMMMHHFLEEDSNARTADEDENLAILGCLLQLQADELRNMAPSRGGLKLWRMNSKKRYMMEGHAMLYANYFFYHLICRSFGTGLGRAKSLSRRWCAM
jgi:hypothetical protein